MNQSDKNTDFKDIPVKISQKSTFKDIKITEDLRTFFDQLNKNVKIVEEVSKLRKRFFLFFKRKLSQDERARLILFRVMSDKDRNEVDKQKYLQTYNEMNRKDWK